MRIMNKTVMPGYKALVLLIALCLSPTTIFAENTSVTAQKLINNMSRAARELNYDGIFIYRRDTQLVTMRLIHKTTDNGEIERLVSLSGAAREVIRNNKSVICIFPDDQAVMVEKSRSHQLLSTQLPEPIEKISAHYDFSIVGRDRVAGKDALIVAVTPNDPYRYGYQLWIDSQSHLLLKSELKNNSGVALEQIMFTKLDVLESIPDELLRASNSGDGYKWYNSVAHNPSEQTFISRWSVKWMPNGFSMSNYENQSIVSSDSPVEHMIYTDGVAMVSVFVEKLRNQAQFKPGSSKMGAVNAFARLANGYQVTAVGEVPSSTVQRMAISVNTDQ